MLNFNQRINLSADQNIHLSFLDSYLDAISEQRDRIKQAIADHDALSRRAFNPDATQEERRVDTGHLGVLFREIQTFFWRWNMAYRMIWTGEQVKINSAKTIYKIGKYRIQRIPEHTRTTFLVELLGNGFGAVIERHRQNIKEFASVRHDLEHVLERIQSGERNLGNLMANTGGLRVFQFGEKRIDISDAKLDLVDLLATDINQWLATVRTEQI